VEINARRDKAAFDQPVDASTDSCVLVIPTSAIRPLSAIARETRHYCFAFGWNGCVQKCDCAVILSTETAGGVLRAFAAETCWCVERKTEGGPIALGGSETSTF
jgi:hypothetical protein